MISEYPERIVCLTEETTETLYLLKEDWRIVGISGFTKRPPHAKKEKPVISSFTKARIDEIVDLQPDLVLGFSDIQASIASQLIAKGVEVHVFNHRTVFGILRMIRTLGAMIGCGDKANTLAQELGSQLQAMATANSSGQRPRVYFEEWNDPLISGIGWISELIEIAGGSDVFSDLASKSLAKDRIVSDSTEVIRRNPDIILGAWCGKRFDTDEVVSRDGWDEIAAIRNGELHEIESSIILQPGPAAVTEGVSAIQRIISRWSNERKT